MAPMWKDGLVLRYLYLENWKSFQESTLLDLVATREQRDGETLTRIKTPTSRVLPIAAMYGANAAGKSSVVQALNALKDIVVEDRTDSASLPVIPSRLNAPDRPTVLEVEFVVSTFEDDSSKGAPDGLGSWSDRTYRYTLSATPKRILGEALTRVRATTEQQLFSRTVDGGVQLSSGLREVEELRLYAATAEKNETLLRRLAVRELKGLEELKSVFNWFQRTLQIIVPESFAQQLPGRMWADDIYREAMSRDLTTADTGITGVVFKEIPLPQIPIGKDAVEEALDELKSVGGLFVFTGSSGRLILLSIKEDEPFVEELVTVHEGESAKSSFQLTLDQESDGTIRYFNLLPMLHDLSAPQTQNVYVVDEIDRSIHPGLIAQIIERFLERCTGQNRSQLIFTTHAASLLRLGLLRRDEVWFVERARDDDGVNRGSELVRLSDLSHWGIRDSTDLFNRYLSGTLPGSPRRSYV